MSDYRINRDGETFDNIVALKQELSETLKRAHPRLGQLYTKIRDKNDVYNGHFRNIYLTRCSYCGVNTQVIDHSQFEVDHFVPQAQKNPDVDVHDIMNLVSACRDCNRKKSNFSIEGKYVDLLHPDKDDVRSVFRRNETFQIEVQDAYAADETICNFHSQLQLGSFTRQLDFLIMEMRACLARNEGWSEQRRAAYHEILLKISDWRKDPYVEREDDEDVTAA